MSVTPLDRPTTSTGALRPLFVPSPSIPRELKPQHFTPPPLVSAQVWFPWDEMAVTLDSPVTRNGSKLLSKVPSPSCPDAFSPQHRTSPPTSAHVCASPAVIAATPVSPGTSVGTWRLVVVPSPSCAAPLSPQHLTLPVEVMTAQVW